jgi:enolase
MSDIDKNLVVQAVISKIKEESDPKIIKVKDLEDYDSPKSIRSDSEEEYTPDIQVNYEDSVNLYEIELEDGEATKKWQTFSSYAKKNKGHLFIVTPDYLKEKIKKEIQDNEFNAGLIYFST